MNLCLVICTKNRLMDLDLTLRSVFNQNVLPDEVLIADDGSEVDTIRLLSKFFRAPISYYHPHLPNTGLTQARNYAIRKLPTGTDIILFIDDDVTLDTEFIKNLKEAFEYNPAVMGASGFIRTEYFVRPWWKKMLLPLISVFPPSKVQASFWHPTMRGTTNRYPVFIKEPGGVISAEWLSGCNMAYRKEVFDKGYRFDETLTGYCLGEDVRFSNTLYKDGYKLVMCQNAQLVHRCMNR